MNVKKGALLSQVYVKPAAHVEMEFAVVTANRDSGGSCRRVNEHGDALHSETQRDGKCSCYLCVNSAENKTCLSIDPKRKISILD